MEHEKEIEPKKRGKGAKKSHLQVWQKLPKYPLWDQVEIRLKAGESAYSLAKWWKSQGHMKHLTVKSLAKYLGTYRKKEIPEDEHVNEFVRGELNISIRIYADPDLIEIAKKIKKSARDFLKEKTNEATDLPGNR